MVFEIQNETLIVMDLVKVDVVDIVVGYAPYLQQSRLLLF